jgi:hypothetical protein
MWRSSLRLFVAALSVAGVRPATAQQSAALRVFVQVARDGAKPVLTLPSVTIHAQPVQVAEGSPLDVQLRTLGIYPDGEAYALVYQLNPGLRGPRAARAGSLMFPTFLGPDTLTKLLATGYLAYVTQDVELKRRLARRIQTLPQIEALLAKRPEERFGGAEEKAQVRRAIGEIRRIAVAVGLALQARSRPVSGPLLSQLDDELAMTTQVLGFAATDSHVTETGKSPLSPTDREAILAVADQFALRAPYWEERHGPELALEPFPDVNVEVYACDPHRPATPPDTAPCHSYGPAHGLRVHYRDKAGYLEGEQPYSFEAVTSPAVQPVSIGNYYFWASTPGSAAPVTDVLEVKVRGDDKPQRVVLIRRP